MAERLVSIVMPAFNEEDNIPRLEQALGAVVEDLPYGFEFLVVEGGSTDRTGELLRALCERDRRWKHISLTRNFSVEASITAGYAYARGDAIIVLYSDLQEPPELIPKFLEKWQQGYDSVYGLQTGREGERRLRSWLVRRAYRFIEASSEVRIPADVCDYRLITSEVRDALLLCEERVRYLRGLIPWLGFRQTSVPYVRREREAGESKASPALLLQYLVNGTLGFSLRPLRQVALLGSLMLLLAVGLGIAALVVALAGESVPLVVGVSAIVALLVGANTLALAVVGEYVGRTFVESLRRPLYLVRETVNVEPAAAPSRSQADVGERHDEPGAARD